MTRHVCEVWAEQGWCPHTRPSLGTIITDVLDGIGLVELKIVLPDGRTLESLLNQFGGRP